jgi:hypothetical protein
VLIVAIAVESDVQRGWSEWTAPRRFLVVAALLVGEIAALLGVALGDEESGGYQVLSSRWLTDLVS